MRGRALQITPDKRCVFCFETNRVDSENKRSFYFEDPVEILVLDDPKNLEPFFKRLSQLNRRYYAAGFFSYELGYLLEDRFAAARWPQTSQTA